MRVIVDSATDPKTGEKYVYDLPDYLAAEEVLGYLYRELGTQNDGTYHNWHVEGDLPFEQLTLAEQKGLAIAEIQDAENAYAGETKRLSE